LLDLAGDLDDLHQLLAWTAAGRFSARGDGRQIVLLGGSVSTAYTYLLARSLEGEPLQQHLVGLVQYGGMFDLFAYRAAWERGAITIDPGISDLEYLLVALGRPAERPELYLRLSPRDALGPATLPRTLLIHAGRDSIVPAAQSALAADRLAALGTPHRLLLYPDLEHYRDTRKHDATQADMLGQTLAFLAECTRSGQAQGR
jgi:acetyl esterase/lipase